MKTLSNGQNPVLAIRDRSSDDLDAYLLGGVVEGVSEKDLGGVLLIEAKPFEKRAGNRESEVAAFRVEMSSPEVSSRITVEQPDASSSPQASCRIKFNKTPARRV